MSETGEGTDSNGGETEADTDTDGSGSVSDSADSSGPLPDAGTPEPTLSCTAMMRDSDLLLDAVVDCGDDDVGVFGVGVAPGDTVTYLAVNSYDDAILVDLDADGIAQDRHLPHIADQALMMAQSPDGDVFFAAAGDTLAIVDADGNVDEVADPGPWTKLGFAIAPDGTMHYWYEDGGTQQHAVQGAGGSWTVEPADAPAEPGHFNRYTLGPNGEVIGVAWLNTVEEGVRRRAVVDGDVTDLVVDPLDWSWILLPQPPLPGPGAGPVVTVGWQQREQISAFYEGAASVVGDSPEWNGACFPTWSDGCPASCHDDSSGVQVQAYGIAQTEVGDTYIATLVRHNDAEYTFSEDCHEFCECARTTQSDATTFELQLHRLGTDLEQGEQILSVPIGEPVDTFDHFQGRVEVEAFGDELAIAVPFKAEPNNLVRVLRVQL